MEKETLDIKITIESPGKSPVIISHKKEVYPRAIPMFMWGMVESVFEVMWHMFNGEGYSAIDPNTKRMGESSS